MTCCIHRRDHQTSGHAQIDVLFLCLWLLLRQLHLRACVGAEGRSPNASVPVLGRCVSHKGEPVARWCCLSPLHLVLHEQLRCCSRHSCPLACSSPGCGHMPARSLCMCRTTSHHMLQCRAFKDFAVMYQDVSLCKRNIQVLSPGAFLTQHRARSVSMQGDRLCQEVQVPGLLHCCLCTRASGLKAAV